MSYEREIEIIVDYVKKQKGRYFENIFEKIRNVFNNDELFYEIESWLEESLISMGYIIREIEASFSNLPLSNKPIKYNDEGDDIIEDSWENVAEIIENELKNCLENR